MYTRLKSRDTENEIEWEISIITSVNAILNARESDGWKKYEKEKRSSSVSLRTLSGPQCSHIYISFDSIVNVAETNEKHIGNMSSIWCVEQRYAVRVS